MIRLSGKRFFDRPYLLLTLTALFWASNAIAGKLAVGIVPPFTLTFVRWFLTALVLYTLARPMMAESRETLMGRRTYLFILGGFGLAGFNFCLYSALNFTSAINTTIEQSSMPMIIILLAFVVFKERIVAGQGVGAALSIFGVMVTATHGDLASLIRLDLNIGDAMMVFGVLLFSAYSVALRRKPMLDWRVFMFGLALGAAIFSLPFALAEILYGHLPMLHWKTPAIILFVTLFPSLMSQIFFIRSIDLIGANRAGIFVNLVPVFGTLLAIAVLGEHLQVFHVVGLALVLSGIALAEITQKRGG